MLLGASVISQQMRLRCSTMKSLSSKGLLRASTAAVAAISVLGLAACGESTPNAQEPAAQNNPNQSSAAPADPGSATNSDTPTATDPDSGDESADFLGPTALPPHLDASIPEALRQNFGGCVELDTAQPVFFDGKDTHGFTCVMTMDNGNAAMVTISEDAEAVNRIDTDAPGVEAYQRHEVPNKNVFSGVRRGTPFVMVTDAASGYYIEYAFGNVPADRARPEIDAVVNSYR